jgi:hypothetical protein
MQDGKLRATAGKITPRRRGAEVSQRKKFDRRRG